MRKFFSDFQGTPPPYSIALEQQSTGWGKSSVSKHVPQDVIDKAVDNFPKRLKKCIDAQGGHFEDK